MSYKCIYTTHIIYTFVKSSHASSALQHPPKKKRSKKSYTKKTNKQTTPIFPKVVAKLHAHSNA